MQNGMLVLAIALGYLLGSMPVGYMLIRFYTGQDIRKLGSGRTGGTNVMRAGGVRVAIMTGVLDILKSASAVWLAQRLVPGNPWAEALSGIAAILGHNYSIFIGFRGGAGGAPAVGGAFGLWPWSLPIILPAGILVWYFVGYASIATLMASVTATIIFAYRWYAVGAPVEHIFYGLLAFLTCLWALRPNIRRLLEGSERVVGYRARRKTN